MNPGLAFILRLILMAIPLYLCNGLALVFGGKTPIDSRIKFFDGKPLLGGGKTFKGTFAGVFFAFLGVLILSILFPQTTEIMGTEYLFYGTLLGIGAVLGDFAGSFLKRRFSIARGRSVFLLDQLDFVVGGLALGAIMVIPTAWEIIFLLALTMIAHVVGNWIAFFARMKKVPW